MSGPQEITLADVYRARDERLVATDETGAASACLVEHALHRRVSGVLEHIEHSVVERLGETSIAEVPDA